MFAVYRAHFYFTELVYSLQSWFPVYRAGLQFTELLSDTTGPSCGEGEPLVSANMGYKHGSDGHDRDDLTTLLNK